MSKVHRYVAICHPELPPPGSTTGALSCCTPAPADQLGRGAGGDGPLGAVVAPRPLLGLVLLRPEWPVLSTE